MAKAAVFALVGLPGRRGETLRFVLTVGVLLVDCDIGTVKVPTIEVYAIFVFRHIPRSPSVLGPNPS